MLTIAAIWLSIDYIDPISVLAICTLKTLYYFKIFGISEHEVSGQAGGRAGGRVGR